MHGSTNINIILCSNKDIIKVVCKKIEWECEDLFKLAQDRNNFLTVVKMEMIIWVA